MILHCNFEELRALTAAGEAIVKHARMGSDAAVAAPSEGVAMVEILLPRLTGDISVETLAEQRELRSAVAVICGSLKARMDETIVEFAPSHEDAVNLYFDYAHSFTVLNRLDAMGTEMEAMIDLMTGGRPELAGSVTFPD